MKPHVHCFTKNWQIQLAVNYLQEKIIEKIRFKMKNYTSRNTELLYYYMNGSLKVLKDEMVIVENTISVIITTSCEIYCVINEKSLCKININEYFTPCFGL